MDIHHFCLDVLKIKLGGERRREKIDNYDLILLLLKK